MFTQPKTCPNAECGATGKFFIKKGYFKTKWNAQPVPRYRCKKCGKFFSSQTLRPTAGQKKPHLNHEIYKLYASGMTQKRLAQVLGCNPKLAKKFIPDVDFVQVPSRVAKAGGPDKMFTLNYTAAKIRNDLSRMARKTWVTTKKAEMLQAHLDLYIAWNNGYKIFHSKSGAV